MLMGLADRTGSFTGTMYLNTKGDRESFEALSDSDSVSSFFAEYYPDAVALLGGNDSLYSQWETNSPGILGTVRTAPWTDGHMTVLMGDAAHAVCPFFGQGANCGFEDVVL